MKTLSRCAAGVDKSSAAAGELCDVSGKLKLNGAELFFAGPV
jgi:hypothetical protein